MNPLAAGLDPKGYPPLAQVRRELKIAWYRCPIDRATLRELSLADDRRGLLHALGHLGLWLATAAASYYCYAAQLWWLFFPALFLHGTVAAFLTAPHHELCHGSVFRTRWLGELFLRLFSLLGWFNFYVYKFSHSYHHRYTLYPQGDREEVMPATPSLKWLYLLQLLTFNVTGGYQSRGLVPTVRNFVELAFDRFDNPFNSWGPELYCDHDDERRQARNWARAVLAFHAVIAAASLAAGQPILVLLVSGSVFIANALRYFVGVPMHCGLRSNVADFRKCVRTIALDPISEFLYWHMNWHLEHHMYAAVPCYNLRRLHETVAGDMPKPRTLLGAWREMREVWHRQQSEPDYAFDTPVPSPAVKDEHTPTTDELAATIGDLAPRALCDMSPARNQSSVNWPRRKA